MEKQEHIQRILVPSRWEGNIPVFVLTQPSAAGLTSEDELDTKIASIEALERIGVIGFGFSSYSLQTAIAGSQYITNDAPFLMEMEEGVRFYYVSTGYSTILFPGEYLLSSRFAYCQAMIAQIGKLVYFFHNTAYNYRQSAMENLQTLYRQTGSPIDNLILIARDPVYMQDIVDDAHTLQIPIQQHAMYSPDNYTSLFRVWIHTDTSGQLAFRIAYDPVIEGA